MESWLDENQEFVQDYFIRKATRNMVDGWLVSHATPVTSSGGSGSALDSPTHAAAGGVGGGGGGGGVSGGVAGQGTSSSRAGSGATTPVR